MFTIPRILRRFFRHDRKPLSELCRCAHQSLVAFLRTVTGRPDGVIGAVMVIQTFGDYARWYPHIHALVADGLFLPAGGFLVMNPETDLRPPAELFRAAVFSDQVIATAILDRLLHHATILKIKGESFRLKEKRKAGIIGRPLNNDPTKEN